MTTHAFAQQLCSGYTEGNATIPAPPNSSTDSKSLVLQKNSINARVCSLVKPCAVFAGTLATLAQGVASGPWCGCPVATRLQGNSNRMLLLMGPAPCSNFHPALVTNCSRRLMCFLIFTLCNSSQMFLTMPWLDFPEMSCHCHPITPQTSRPFEVSKILPQQIARFSLAALKLPTKNESLNYPHLLQIACMHIQS